MVWFRRALNRSGQTWRCPRRGCSSSRIPREKVDCVVVGAGVVGLAVARAMSMPISAQEGGSGRGGGRRRRRREVLVLEAAPDIGSGTSSRNSEVIHAGIYYPQSSLKALLCVEGRKALYSYVREHDVPFKQLGKLIVATNALQIPALESIFSRGQSNGVEDLCFLSKQEVSDLEPNINCVRAILSPSTGIIDSHTFMRSLQADAEAHGASFAFNSSVIQGNVSADGIELYVCDTEALRSEGAGDEPDLNASTMVLCAETVVNAAGLNAVALARSLNGFPSKAVPPSFFARGCYFSLTGVKSPPFGRLIYPIPEEGGLGVHVTLDLGGQVRFGPDVEWLHEMDATKAYNLDYDYHVDPCRAERFYPEVRKYYPALEDGMLKADYAGIRPKISGPGSPPADFVIQTEKHHSIHGLVNLFGIESPGLTACLAIADRVVAATP